ncbi:raffinose/stachyose/melibiose transport system substrate-binding protein [Thermocatellispora tengchongensis]|uniref:Raffinose/stachyose/melibiose transport system substrate-binding protein n=1 Tax=Thermocatellispora tengchongensis TaxID=1073253 RepID=A0A840P0D1_9ACTN|nr:extracellular solute-binding protein [Thermocatellispora tengchongensis]MBB5131361.1 raffinose/stachyose/melibiose transport system substrate-binding protein [Thermocatellispora tengchongensis]
MKSLKTLALGCCLAVAATACSTSGGGSTTAASGDQVLTLAAAGQGPASAAVKAFEKANPGVTVKTVFTEDDTAYQQQLRTQLASGTAPDVFRMWPGGGNTMAVRDLGKDGMLMDLSGESWAAGLSADLKSVTSDPGGKVMAVPVTIGAIGAVWNDQALAKSGLSKPATWPEVLKFCKDAKAKGVTAFALGLKSSWVTQLVPYALTASLVYGPNPAFTQQQKDGKATFAGSQWKQALEQYLQMRDEGCFNDSPNGVGYDEQMQLFGQGKALGVVHVLSAVQSAIEYAPEGTTFSMTPFPATDNAGDTYLPVSVGIVYGVNAKAKNPELAKKFMQFLASPEGQALYATESGSSPALDSPSFKADALQQPVLDAVKSGRSTLYPDQAWPNPRVQQEHLTSIQELFNGTVDVKTVLSRMDKAFTSTS